ncbi:NOP protein chaperone 1 [Phascolarctos cinereus]
MAGLEEPGNGGRGRAPPSGGPGGVRTTVSRELLHAGCAGAGGLQDTLLISSKGKSPGLKTVRVERSSLLERVKNFLPHIEQANKKLREEMASGPPGLFNIENVDDCQEKIIEMDVAMVEVSSSDSEDLSSGESSESEDENSVTGEVTVENIKLPNSGQRRGKIEVLDT